MRLGAAALGLILIVGCTQHAALTIDGAVSGAGGHAGNGQDAGGDGAAGTQTVNCATVGCAAPPQCAVGCQEPCGCCPCAEGDRQGALVCAGGCWTPSDAGVDSPAPIDAAPHCPANLPKDGELCRTSSLFCEFPGPDLRGFCGPQAFCLWDQGPNPAETSHWRVTPAQPACGTHPSPCPAAFTTLAEGADCPAAAGSLSCDYDEGRCGCLACGGATLGSSMWSCRPWASAEPGCPPTSPLAGSPCSTPDAICFYAPCGTIAVGDNLQCRDGIWQIRSIGGTCGIPTCSQPK